jgi:hypothetical protein
VRVGKSLQHLRNVTDHVYVLWQTRQPPKLLQLFPVHSPSTDGRVRIVCTRQDSFNGLFCQPVERAHSLSQLGWTEAGTLPVFSARGAAKVCAVEHLEHSLLQMWSRSQ